MYLQISQILFLNKNILGLDVLKKILEKAWEYMGFR